MSVYGMSMKSFQSALPHEERFRMNNLSQAEYQFQSALPHEERSQQLAPALGFQVFQSALPHEERFGWTSSR